MGILATFEVVRRRLAFAGVLVAAVVGAGAARADWQVHRDGSRALVERAEQALRDRPDDDALARRLVQLAGREQTAGLRERFRARAAAATGYAPIAAYAQLLLALRDAPAAARAFGEALRVSPDAPAALAGRARALAISGSSEAVAAYEAAIKREVRPPARRRLIEAELALLPSEVPGASPTDAGRADPEQVVRLRRELAHLAPDSDRAAEQLAEALARAGRPGEAAAILEQRIAPDHLLAKLPLVLRAARLRLADRDASEAARAAETLGALLREIPRGATENRRAAWTCAREVARARGTLGALAQEMAEAPASVEWDLLSQVREELGDLEGARAATQTAAALAPRDAALGDRLLRLLDRLGRDEEASGAAQELTRAGSPPRSDSRSRLRSDSGVTETTRRRTPPSIVCWGGFRAHPPRSRPWLRPPSAGATTSEPSRPGPGLCAWIQPARSPSSVSARRSSRRASATTPAGPGPRYESGPPHRRRGICASASCCSITSC